MKAIKICGNVWKNASRDKRELSVLSELGYDVSVVAKGHEKDFGRQDCVDGYTVYRYTTRPFGNGRLAVPIGRIASLFIWAHGVRKMNADIITGENKSGTLIGYMSNMFKPAEKRAKLVYDCHEFEIFKSSKRNAFQRLGVKYLEKFLIKHCSFSIMVNDGIADGVQKIHKLAQRPVVVRSTPEYWEIDKAVSESMHGQFCEALHVPEDTFIVIYTGYLMEFRGLEEILGALALKKDICAVWVGDAPTAQYEQRLMDMASSLGVSARLLRYPAQPHAELWKYISGADVSAVVMNDKKNRNYGYALPNKFFEAIQSTTPVICSNTPEMARIVKQYGIGLLTPAGSSEALASAISELQHSRALYDSFKKNLIPAKNELCWEKEKQVLIAAYSEIMT